MATVMTIDPVTRIEGHLSVKIEIDIVNGVQQVTNAWATGTLNRFLEVMRVIHSFDPCLSCAMHMVRPDEPEQVVVSLRSRA